MSQLCTCLLEKPQNVLYSSIVSNWSKYRGIYSTVDSWVFPWLLLLVRESHQGCCLCICLGYSSDANPQLVKGHGWRWLYASDWLMKLLGLVLFLFYSNHGSILLGLHVTNIPLTLAERRETQKGHCHCPLTLPAPDGVSSVMSKLFQQRYVTMFLLGSVADGSTVCLSILLHIAVLSSSRLVYDA